MGGRESSSSSSKRRIPPMASDGLISTDVRDYDRMSMDEIMEAISRLDYEVGMVFTHDGRLAAVEAQGKGSRVVSRNNADRVFV